MMNSNKKRQSAAAISDMRASNDSLREKFGRLCKQTGSSEYQEKYKKRDFDPIKAKKQVKTAQPRQSGKAAHLRKPKKAIEAELLPPKIDNANKENSDCTNSYADNFSDAPTAETYVSSGLRSGRSSTINSDTNVEDNQNLASVEIDVEALAASSGNVGKKIQKRISEYDEKFIPWPVQEHVPHYAPTDHEIIANPNTTSFPCNWQSVTQAEMQSTAELLAHSQNVDKDDDFSLIKAHTSTTPLFFAWSGATPVDIEKKVLTYENAHSEYRDCYNKKVTEITKHVAPPRDHEILGFGSHDNNESNWSSTMHAEQGDLEHARLQHVEGTPAGLSSQVIAEHLTGRKGPPPAPVFFAWSKPTPPPQRSEEEIKACHNNIHTETRDNYTQYSSMARAERVPPPMDHNILESVTDHPIPMVYESEARSQMIAAKKAREEMKSGDVSGSSSALLKKDYRKSYAPGYFAWPVPQQFAEKTIESHENCHTEYRDSYLSKNNERTQRVQPPDDHNVLGYEDNIDPTVWSSVAQSQMQKLEESQCEEKVAGAPSAFLAKDHINLCPPGFFAWPVPPQPAQRSQNQNAGPRSEYSDNFQGVAQVHNIQRPPLDHDVIVGSVDADHASEWQSVAQSLMKDAKEKAQSHDEVLSLSVADRDYRRSFAPQYFAWPVKDQKAERTAEAASNVHTEYRDSFVNNQSTTTRVPAPEDHIQLGSDSTEGSPENWKSIAHLQSEVTEEDMHSNGQDVQFKSQSVTSAPNFFAWPKEKLDKPAKSVSSKSKKYGYGGEICTEYDSKFIDHDVHNVHISPVKLTQTIPVNEVDPSVWKSTTKTDMESSIKSVEETTELRAPVTNLEKADYDKPMNFAWEPLPAMRSKRKLESSKKGPFLTTEHRLRYVDWTPEVKAIHEHHLAETESNTNTITPKKDVKFGGTSETKSKFQAWSPIVTRKGSRFATNRYQGEAVDSCLKSIDSSRKSIDSSQKSNDSSRKSIDSSRKSNSEKASEMVEDEIKSRASISSRSASIRSQDGSCHASQKSAENQLSAKNTVDSGVFSADSLDNRSLASSSVASSRRWHVSDDICALRQTSRLGLREDISNNTKHRRRATSAPTRRRPQNTHQYTDNVNPILRNMRYPGAVAVSNQSAHWSTETSSKFTWK